MIETAPQQSLVGKIRRWLLLWQLYGLPRCSQAVPPDLLGVPHCWRLIWPWQEREVRNGSPVHTRCLASEPEPIAVAQS